MIRQSVFLLAAIGATVFAQNDSFDLVDANNDGKLSEKELITFMRKRGRPDGQEYFQRFDLDRNGHLDISEFVPLVYEMSRRPVDMDYEFFKKMDLNDDGIVDKAEVEKIRKDNNDRIIDGILSIADTNRDGQLTYAEFKNHLSSGAKSLSPAEEQRNQALQLLSFIDANGDNKLDQLELYTFSQKTSTNKVTKSDVQQIFAMLDKNQDGYLTENELLQLAQQFSTIGNVRSTIPKV
ncbi:EF-hand domain-containing protein [Caenorhabditis elegans]|uniref:EF-hand domain-containing protein n=1 Tax=Caenorhabditis elegans TaxID=6239 RepID=O76670_CAEEL|nr:EF-hand domain-containing protein [Caenorhabditis elegans]CCD68272.1 EF-hand domain-containing protein [Caenorhabditis elegans]|eukprot:NP_497128.1 Uncharacterized protein CELE_H10E21.4 [Caenorhabditis elegans]